MCGGSGAGIWECLYPGHVDVIIIGQGVQHLHHRRFDQFEGESADTAAPAETHNRQPSHIPEIRALHEKVSS